MLATITVACGTNATFNCDDPSHCMAGPESGFCEPSGYCSFPDDDCPSGRRYGKHAATGLADLCVPPDTLTEGVLDSTTTGTSTDSHPTSHGPDDTAGSDTLVSTTGVSSEPTTGHETTSDTTATSGTTPVQVEVPASIAECTDPVQLDPAACAASDGSTSLSVDAQDSAFGGQPTSAWLRFDLPAEIRGLDVTSVRLRLVVTDEATADSDSTGEIWSVEPFDLSSLTRLQPQLIEVLAPDAGPVTHGAVVDWPLPSSTAEASVLYLGVIAVSDDGVNYWNNEGASPPALVIDAE